MHSKSSWISRTALVAAVACAVTAGAEAASLGTQVDAVVARYRKSIVLLSDQATLDDEARERSLIVGRMLFEENREAIEELTRNAQASPEKIGELLGIVEKRPDLRDADKLAFREIIDRLKAGLPKGNAKLLARLDEDAKALAEIRALYDKELEKIFGQTQTRGIAVRREAWESYVAFVRSLYTREAILKEYEDALGSISESTRGKEVVRKAGPLEITGFRLPKKTLVLTFDDGPDSLYTPAILDILAKYEVRSIFFQVGKNAGAVSKAKGKETIIPTKAAESTVRLLANGHLLGNHTYSHALLTKLKDEKLEREIDLGERILESVSQTDVKLFRPPYGARNDAVLDTLKERNEKAFIWNVDSLDWSDPVPKSIASRVVEQVEQQGKGVILMHDVHPQSVEALPLILEALKGKGYQFALWDGAKFLEGTGPTRGAGGPAQAAVTADGLYRKSWAVVIGVNAYEKWPKLAYAVNDAQAVRDVLVKKYLFPPEQVITLLDKDATRERILAVLGDQLASSEKVQKDDRVFVFFAGHGVTRKLPNGRSLGYIVPVDADTSQFQSTAISMTSLQDASEAIAAKHVFFVMDACYSGIALTRGRAAQAGDPRKYLEEITRRAARQVLTAGGADEQVADNGPNGHSIFTWTLLQGLEGRADLNGDGFITASELGAYVGPAVSSLSRQTPAFGSLVGSEGGELVLELEHESEDLSDQSSQLDAQAIRLNAELEQVRKAIAEKAARNEKLASELAQAQAELQKVAGATQAAVTPEEESKRQNDAGMKLYREKKYTEALAAFQAAAKANPQDAQAANNVGFLYFKMAKYDDALTWLEKTRAVDPARPVTYVNLGDTYDKLSRRAEALAAYQKYLELMPESPLASKVKEKLAKLK